MRDGVSLNSVKRVEPIVMPIEISSLENLECIVKLPGNFPITSLKMSYKDIPNLNDRFVINEAINKLKSEPPKNDNKEEETRLEEEEMII